MLEGKSSDFKTLVLLRITKKLIENTESYGIHRLENILNKNIIVAPVPVFSEEELKKEKEEVVINQKNQIKESVRNKFRTVRSPGPKEFVEKVRMTPSIKIKEDTVWAEPAPEMPVKVLEKRRVAHPQSQLMRVPGKKKLEYNDSLPSHLRYLRPTPTLKRVGMDLGELNPYLEDPNVDSIEVEGENEKVFVIGKMGKKPTSLILSKEEIEEVIDRFSKEAKIPKVDGLFKVSINNLILTAMVSNVISSRFIIKKIRL